MEFFDRLFDRSTAIEPSEVIRRLASLGDSFPTDERVSKQLFDVLISLPTSTKPEKEWPAELRDVIAKGEEVVEILGRDLEGNPNDRMGKKLYFAIALTYIKSPSVIEPLCRFLEMNIAMMLWPSKMSDSITMFDAYEVIYIAIARALYWNQAVDVLPRLRVILEKGKQKRMLNALPYAIRAIGFIGNDNDIPLVEQFFSFSCPGFDLSEKAVKIEAKHALYALRHPEKRNRRANSHIDSWKC